MNTLRTLALQSQENFLNLFRKSKKGESDEKCSNQIFNPIRLFSLLSFIDWCTFFSAYFCVTIDFMEYSTVAVESVELSNHFQASNAAISTGLMLSMISGVIGAIFFGLLGDCGRKTPLVINCIYLSIMQILITQCTSINQFLIVKTMSGFGIGGLFGNALQSVLDRIPTEAKGLMAGILWSAGDFGVFLTSAIKLALNKTKKEHDWTLIFWISAALSFAAAIVRICVPESPQFQRENVKNEEGQTMIQKAKRRIQDTKLELNIFITNLRQLFKTHWMTFIYLAIFVCLLSSVANIYETIYPTFLEEGKRFDKESIPKTIMIVSLGGFIGSCSGAGFSQSTGRRICVIFASFIALCLIPAYILPNKPIPLSFGGFFFVMISNMANSVTSIHISELSSPAFRSVMSGSAYQLGQTLSSPAGVLVNALATSFQTQKENQETIEKSYVPVIGITMAILYVLIIILTAIGPEKHAADFENFIPANKEVLKSPDFIESDDSSSTNVTQSQSLA